MSQPLQGIRIVDLSTVFSGPMAAALLADQGAEVIKVESPEGDTSRLIGHAKGDLSSSYIGANRGKRSIALDLKLPAARELVLALIARADVLMENFRPGVMARLGLADDDLARQFPALVRLSITGFGATGPRADERAYDAVIQAVSGFPASQRDPRTGEPMMIASTVCDKLTALTAAQAVTAALLARGRDGRGQRVEVAMLDAALWFQWPDAMYNHVFLDQPPPPHPEFGSTQRPWKLADGYAATMVPQQAEFAGLCRALGRPDIPQDPRFATLAARYRHGAELRALLEPLMAAVDKASFSAACRREGVPMALLNERQEVLAEPQLAHNGTLVTLANGDAGRVRVARSAALFDGQQQLPRSGAPRLGEHGREILLELGLDDERIAALVADGVVKLPAVAPRT